MTDADLVRQATAGRAEAYEELVRRWAGRITALCHAKAGCAAAADDLAQEALVRAYRALESLADPEKFGPWLCQIARRGCLNWLKARGRDHVPFSALGPDRDPNEFLEPAADERPEDDLDRLRQEVAELPADYREVVLLYYHGDVTHRDLAELLGVSAATVNARLTKARLLLRQRLSKCRR